MLAKPNRLRKQQDFAAVHKQGTRRSSTHLTLKLLAHGPRSTVIQVGGAQAMNPDLTASADLGQASPTRFGISISQKVSKRATVRNRIKRQLRAACRQLLPQLPNGWDVVIVVRPGIAPCDYHQFLQELKQLLMAAELLNGH
jgi:ribonuclease P protein component